ncbi:(S)-2-hydroxy-acid oxidase [Ranunculus cassubicifolius]
MAVEPVNISDFHEIAKKTLPKIRVLQDVSRINLGTTVLGYNTSSPIMIAPTGMHKLAHPEGEIVYMYKRRDISALLIQREERCGYKAIVFTDDTPWIGRREADIKNKMISPQLKNFEGLLSTKFDTKKGSNLEAFASKTFDPLFTWKDIEWLKFITKLPILIKGVLTAEDVVKAVEVGVAGIIVSNHGGRQLDHAPATITVLEEVVQAVRGKVPVLFDGGIRRGTDIFKALALGAQAVLIGRPVIYGLAARGEYGVRRVIEMLKDELELTMTLCGCSSVKDIKRSHVKTEYDRTRSSL